MEWWVGLSIYLGIGVVIFAMLWKLFHIMWQFEAADMKALMVVTPFLWPLVLVFILVMKLWR